MKPENGHQAENSGWNIKWWQSVLLLGVLVIVIAGMGVWLTASTSGLKWLGSAVSHLSAGNISLEGLDGKLSQSIKADVVRFTRDDLLVVARGVQLNWQPDALLSKQLKIVDLTAEDVEIISPPSPEPSSLPDNLELPLSLLVQKVDIGVLRVLHGKGGAPVF